MNEQFNSIKIHGINNIKTVNAQKAKIIHNYRNATGTAVVQWLRYSTNRKVGGSIPDGVIRIFH
jgi:hypothetical protein